MTRYSIMICPTCPVKFDCSVYIDKYALILKDKKNYDKAEECYKWVLKTDPKNAINLVDYALFLKDIRKDYDKAEEYYQRALKIDSKKVTNI